MRERNHVVVMIERVLRICRLLQDRSPVAHLAAESFVGEPKCQKAFLPAYQNEFEVPNVAPST